MCGTFPWLDLMLNDSKCVIQCKAPILIGFDFINVTHLRISHLTILFCRMAADYSHIEVFERSYFTHAASMSVIYLKRSSILFNGDVNITNAIEAIYSNITVYGNNHLQRISLEQSVLSFHGDVTFTGNLGGAIYATNSKIHFQQSFKIEFVKKILERKVVL